LFQIIYDSFAQTVNITLFCNYVLLHLRRKAAKMHIFAEHFAFSTAGFLLFLSASWQK